jgi:hypothetical protein
VRASDLRADPPSAVCFSCTQESDKLSILLLLEEIILPGGDEASATERDACNRGYVNINPHCKACGMRARPFDLHHGAWLVLGQTPLQQMMGLLSTATSTWRGPRVVIW